MRYLIDGYNLLHAWGMLRHGTKVPPRTLEQARHNLLERLLRYGAGGGITVVFDARGAPPGVPVEEDYRGIRVCFAVDGTADDRIEDLLRHEGAPQHLTVVSDDNRLRQAARRRHCRAQRCLDYLDQLRHPAQPLAAPPPEPPAKPGALSPEETRRWLEEFGEVDGGDEPPGL
jgi:hypothetical protein